MFLRGGAYSLLEARRRVYVRHQGRCEPRGRTSGPDAGTGGVETIVAHRLLAALKATGLVAQMNKRGSLQQAPRRRVRTRGESEDAAHTEPAGEPLAGTNDRGGGMAVAASCFGNGVRNLYVGVQRTEPDVPQQLMRRSKFEREDIGSMVRVSRDRVATDQIPYCVYRAVRRLVHMRRQPAARRGFGVQGHDACSVVDDEVPQTQRRRFDREAVHCETDPWADDGSGLRA